MEISLIRHGKSTHIDNDKLDCHEFTHWVKKYDESGVFEEDFYPLETIEKIKNASIVITSDLNRSIESAELLKPNSKVISSHLFREAELPILTTKLWGVKLKPRLWSVILRCLWFGGYANKCESLSNAKNRAKKAAGELISQAQEHQSVAFVGHGFINLLIAKELQRLGWRGKRKTDSKHWNCTTYSLHS